MNITVEIKAPELAHAILVLAEALKGTSFAPQVDQVVTQAPAEPGVVFNPEQVYQPHINAYQQPAPTAPVQQQPVNHVVPIQQQAPPMQQAPTAPPAPPMQQAPTAPAQPVPTTAPGYSMDQLAVAATQLMDAGRQPELVALLGAFGAQSMMQLPKEHYGAFATKLREMGAKI